MSSAKRNNSENKVDCKRVSHFLSVLMVLDSLPGKRFLKTLALIYHEIQTRAAHMTSSKAFQSMAYASPMKLSTQDLEAAFTNNYQNTKICHELSHDVTRDSKRFSETVLIIIDDNK